MKFAKLLGLVSLSFIPAAPSVTLPPTKKLDRIGRILLGAIDQIEEHGWGKGHKTYQGHICAMEAIDRAMVKEINKAPWYEKPFIPSVRSLRKKAYGKVTSLPTVKKVILGRWPVDVNYTHLWIFNDAQNVQQEHVTTALRKAAYT